MRNKDGTFKKGFGFWIGKKRPGLKTRTQFSKGQIPWNKGRKSPETSGENNPSWKGNNIGYTGIHAWVVRQKGKACKCTHCNRTKMPIGMIKYFNWANISGRYERNLKDWIQLCRPCHIAFDRSRGVWGNATKLWKL